MSDIMMSSHIVWNTPTRDAAPLNTRGRKTLGAQINTTLRLRGRKELTDKEIERMSYADLESMYRMLNR